MPAVTHVATLIGHAGGLGERHLGAARAALPGAAPPRWLAPGTAADIAFAPPPGSGDPAWSETVRRALGDAPVDVVAQPLAGRRKRLLVADMDATLIQGECIDDLAALMGQGEAVSALTRASVRGETDFDESLRRRVALLAGLGVEAVEALAARAVPTLGAAALVATMRAHGAMTVLASGGFTCFTAAVAARLGLDRHHGNELAIENGLLTGSLRGPILGPGAKARILRETRDELRLHAAATLAVGDGANDLGMLGEAGLGVAFRAAPAVAAVCRARIDHGDLTALLYLQGYAADEFARGAAS